MSSYYNGSQEREWPGSEQDPEWCYFCDRPKNDCACEPSDGPDSRVLSDGPYASGACCQGWTLCGLHDTECGNYGEGL
jgi:hypothetical protein